MYVGIEAEYVVAAVVVGVLAAADDDELKLCVSTCMRNVPCIKAYPDISPYVELLVTF